MHDWVQMYLKKVAPPNNSLTFFVKPQNVISCYQHRTSVLRDFEALVVFHGVRKSYFFTFLPLHHCTSSSTEDKGDDVTDHLEDLINCFVHNFLMF
jgi:hypothetical protein